MNREIKFRGLIKGTTDKLVYGWGCFTDTSSREYVISEIYPIEYTQVENIQRFTGLTDKNGKEIYEGDILKRQPKDPKYPEEVGEVKYAPSCFILDLGAQSPILAPWVQEADFQVIGNVFDNPELLTN